MKLNTQYNYTAQLPHQYQTTQPKSSLKQTLSQTTSPVNLPLPPKASSFSQIQVEDYDEHTDGRFVRDFLCPYFVDLYKDLTLRCLTPAAIKEKKLDRITFLEYCNLPGIINDRLLKIFDTNNDGLISENSFVSNLSYIFASDLETRMRITFCM